MVQNFYGTENTRDYTHSCLAKCVPTQSRERREDKFPTQTLTSCLLTFVWRVEFLEQSRRSVLRAGAVGPEFPRHEEASSTSRAVGGIFGAESPFRFQVGRCWSRFLKTQGGPRHLRVGGVLGASRRSIFQVRRCRSRFREAQGAFHLIELSGVTGASRRTLL